MLLWQKLCCLLFRPLWIMPVLLTSASFVHRCDRISDVITERVFDFVARQRQRHCQCQHSQNISNWRIFSVFFHFVWFALKFNFHILYTNYTAYDFFAVSHHNVANNHLGVYIKSPMGYCNSFLYQSIKSFISDNTVHIKSKERRYRGTDRVQTNTNTQ